MRPCLCRLWTLRFGCDGLSRAFGVSASWALVEDLLDADVVSARYRFRLWSLLDTCCTQRNVRTSFMFDAEPLVPKHTVHCRIGGVSPLQCDTAASRPVKEFGGVQSRLSSATLVLLYSTITMRLFRNAILALERVSSDRGSPRWWWLFLVYRRPALQDSLSSSLSASLLGSRPGNQPYTEKSTVRSPSEPRPTATPSAISAASCRAAPFAPLQSVRLGLLTHIT